MMDANSEYKIMTTNLPYFSKKVNLQKVLNEEAKAGWDLVEVFDSQKIRLCRPISARENDDKLDFNPYRTSVGLNDYKLLVVVTVWISIGLGAAYIFSTFLR